MFRGGEDVLTRGKAEIRVGRCHVRYTLALSNLLVREVLKPLRIYEDEAYTIGL